MSDRRLVESLFPRLKGTDWSITSPADRAYNCVAWAAMDTQRWWWPRSYWPGKDRDASLDGFVAVFVALGYVTTDSDIAEPGIEKIAIYVKDEQPTHVARQLGDGAWTSKLGRFVDIRHALHDLEGEEYGSVARVLKKAATPAGT